MNLKKLGGVDSRANPYDPMIRGESAYDRVTSILMSVVMGAVIIVGWLFLVYHANRAYAARSVARVEIIEVSGDGGAGGDEIAGGDPAMLQPTNNADPEDTRKFAEPTEIITEGRVLDPSGFDDGGEVSPGRTTQGDGDPTTRPKGPIGGDGGGSEVFVPRARRWTFEHPPGQTEADYKAELDSLGIELATPAGPTTLVYASKFSTTPVQRTGQGRQEARLYTSWSSPERKKLDVELMKSAGITVDADAIVFQFMPKEVGDRLNHLETAYKGLLPVNIRRTRFKVVSKAGKYDFEVVSQEPLDSALKPIK
jgi:hypothetical protein